MRRTVTILLCALVCMSAFGQADRREVRAGNRKFRKGDYQAAEIDYRKAALKDSLSLAAEYNLGSDLYMQEDYAGALKAFDTVKDLAPASGNAARWWFNKGDAALKTQDYASAVEDFKQALLLEPGDIDAKENYIYAKLMLRNQQNQGGGQSDQDQKDQNDRQDQNKDQQDQNQQNNDQNQDQQDQDRQNPDQQPKISPQQAQQMLNAIQAKEKETQDKVNQEKAKANPDKKEKNW